MVRSPKDASDRAYSCNARTTVRRSDPARADQARRPTVRGNLQVSRLEPSVTVRATEGMVCAIDHLAAQAGVAMLRAGGSAGDAAVATSAVLAVTSQHMCGMGGDLLAVVAQPGAEPIALNSSGRAGSGADPERLRSAGHSKIPFRGDFAAVTVPGCVDGWLALHNRYGRLPLGEVLAPARRYAERGFPASPTLAEEVGAITGLEEATDYTEPGPIRPGTIIRRPGVARAFDAITTHGREGFYGGEFGAGLLQIGGGEYLLEDLERDLADWVPGLSAEAFGHRIWTVPPNSQGYLTASSAWIASGLGIGSDSDDPRWAHLLIESARQAAYDRLEVLYEGADGAALVDPARLAPRRDAIDPDHAAVLGDQYRDGGTIALCVVDSDRLGITVLQSNASGFGSHLVIPGLRIFLHNRGIGFSLEPGHKGGYAPGRRPAHTLCPTLVTRPDGSLAGVLGTMGGDTQPQILLQVLARWLASPEEPGDILAAGRWALAHPGDGNLFDTWRAGGDVRVVLEGQVPPRWAAGLTARGHRVTAIDSYGRYFGHAHLITVADDHLAGATDPRPRFGAAAGY